MEKSFEEISQYFGFKLEDACKLLQISSTSLKKICRKNKIKRWPYRRLTSLMAKCESIEETLRNKTLSSYIKVRLHAKLEKIRNEVQLIKKTGNREPRKISKPNKTKKQKEVTQVVEPLPPPPSVPSNKENLHQERLPSFQTLLQSIKLKDPSLYRNTMNWQWDHIQVPQMVN